MKDEIKTAIIEGFKKSKIGIYLTIHEIMFYSKVSNILGIKEHKIQGAVFSLESNPHISDDDVILLVDCLNELIDESKIVFE